MAYVAKHGSGGNDDEGAIAHALRQLGHEVLPIAESNPKPVEADFTLFHKWYPPSSWPTPLVFWYFDLVDYPDPTLAGRNRQRRDWMDAVIPRCVAGFCTDGDWAKRCGLHHLPQGADERRVGYYDDGVVKTGKYLLTCSTKGGRGREAFVSEVRTKYGHDLIHVQNGLHGRQLGYMVGAAKVVFAPSEPVTDNYWSNRVYNVLGFGGVMLHPWSQGLMHHIAHPGIVTFYGGMREFHDRVEMLSSMTGEERLARRLAAIKCVRERHLYRHRCEELIRCLNRS